MSPLSGAAGSRAPSIAIVGRASSSSMPASAASAAGDFGSASARKRGTVTGSGSPTRRAASAAARVRSRLVPRVSEVNGTCVGGIGRSPSSTPALGRSDEGGGELGDDFELGPDSAGLPVRALRTGGGGGAPERRPKGRGTAGLLVRFASSAMKGTRVDGRRSVREGFSKETLRPVRLARGYPNSASEIRGSARFGFGPAHDGRLRGALHRPPAPTSSPVLSSARRGV